VASGACMSLGSSPLQALAVGSNRVHVEHAL
jgi:hypothetical protein